MGRHQKDISTCSRGVALPGLLLLCGWLWIGFDRYVGDHEVGAFWEPVLKAQPTFTVLFRNPAQRALDREPYDSLDAARQQAFRTYRSIRYAMTDPQQCEKAIEDRRL
ncbi:hypothetical protein [Paracidovorax konjaci]|uniref:Uncharacterized protein n=1 Tax=Paracidovorax konjaci TaxID=32040 RepID=A0A1I1V683_9BURK|nr:hypothetical protein [Paracidovorax konjaci]SFD78551.1 hypothetical protein SAMN04489710_10681 [Paracidovorax konjaci]